MNTLTDAQRDRVLRLLRDGKSLRRIEHETGHRRETIAEYGRRAGLLPQKRYVRRAAPSATTALLRAA